jgi:7-cyano-7-deazaguanine synthase
MTKAEIIRRGEALGVPFKWTHSCYDPDLKGRACGACDSCLIRKKGFAEAGLADPTVYQGAGKSLNERSAEKTDITAGAHGRTRKIRRK